LKHRYRANWKMLPEMTLTDTTFGFNPSLADESRWAAVQRFVGEEKKHQRHSARLGYGHTEIEWRR